MPSPAKTTTIHLPPDAQRTGRGAILRTLAALHQCAVEADEAANVLRGQHLPSLASLYDAAAARTRATIPAVERGGP